MEREIQSSIIIATSKWLKKNQKNVEYFSPSLMTFLFLNIENLNYALKKTDFPWTEKYRTGSINNGKNGTHINFDISLNKSIYFRAIIGFINDIYNITNTIRNYKNKTTLGHLLKQLFKEINKFKDLRHFFIHLDEHLYDREKHGIDGPRRTNCGIEYNDNAKGYFHLVVIENSIFFSRQKKCFEIELKKESFNNLFEIAKNIYNELIAAADNNHDFINIDEILI